MADLGYASALLLALVFAWAGLAKLAARRQTEAAFRSMAVPAPGGLAVAVPAAELALALALVLQPGWAAVAALAVLAGFTTLVARSVRAGIQGGCACFGTAMSRPVSRIDLVRNGLLAAVAGVATFAPSAMAPDPGALALVVAAAACGQTLLAYLRVRSLLGPARAAGGRGPGSPST